MKTIFCATLLAFSLTMAASLPAEAGFIVQTKVNSGAFQQIAPFFRVKTDGTQLLTISAGTSIRYYFYEGALPVTFAAPTAPPGTTISVKRLSQTYTTSSNGKNANYMVTVTATTSHQVSSSIFWEFSFTLAATDGRPFTQGDDWSYPGSTVTMFADNPKVVLQQSLGSSITLWGNWPSHDRPTNLTLAKQKIKHVFVIMQENRAFDHYFGTFTAPSFVTIKGDPFPGVDGVANTPLETAGRTAACSGTVYNPGLLGATDTSMNDLPHLMPNAKISLGCPQTSGEQNRTCNIPPGSTPFSSQPLLIKDFLASTGVCDDTTFKHSVGHFEGNAQGDPLYNHWTIAHNFILQDRMFAPVPSYSLMSHLFLVSGWSARCNASGASCVETYDGMGPQLVGPYGWKDISSALTDKSPSVSWGYYKGENWNFNCGGSGANETCKTSPASCFTNGDAVVSYWNPLPDFKGVQQRSNTGKIQPLQNLLSAINLGESNVPAVVWIVPGKNVSEHPQGGDLRHGEAYATMLIQRIMSNSALWKSSAVFLAWDDWGGFYDHVRPPTESFSDGSTKLMYGIRVGGVAISPWVHSLGTVDHQTLSFDAYLKLIEDIFLSGERLSGDGRSSVRESQAVLGDLLDEFDFHRTPLDPPAQVTALSCNAP